MAYYISPKSLRSQEEFRKNPHIKIPPKSPQISMKPLRFLKIIPDIALATFKNYK
jgi:hypothetical protein